MYQSLLYLILLRCTFDVIYFAELLSAVIQKVTILLHDVGAEAKEAGKRSAEKTANQGTTLQCSILVHH